MWTIIITFTIIIMHFVATVIMKKGEKKEGGAKGWSHSLKPIYKMAVLCVRNVEEEKRFFLIFHIVEQKWICIFYRIK